MRFGWVVWFFVQLILLWFPRSAISKSVPLPKRVAPFGLPSQMPPLNPNSDQQSYMVSSQCSCGSLRAEFPVSTSQASSIAECHCPSCRRYHVSAFVRYLEIPANGLLLSGDTAVTYTDSCSELGNVQRTFCRRCKSKLLTRPALDGSKTILVNMGPIVGQTVPDALTEQWRTTPVTRWQSHMEVSWSRPRMGHDPQAIFSGPPPVRMTGGCTCGACQYDFQLVAPMEIQHCYCYLCRQLSGGLYMSWVPVRTFHHKFQWILADSAKSEQNSQKGVPDSPLTIRYTDMGARHVCNRCGGVLSILYDYENTSHREESAIWLAAGGFDSIRLPYNIDPYVSRMAHICRRYKPSWYVLPKDEGYEYIDEAS